MSDGGYIAFRAGLESQSRMPVPTAASPHDQFIVGCDLGQAQDYTALCVVEKITVDASEIIQQKGFEPPRATSVSKKVHHIRHLQRLKLGTGYPEIVQTVGTMLKALPVAKMPPALVVDATGVGRPVIDMMRKAGLKPVSVSITGGHDENYVGSNEWRIPKRNLVSTLAVCMQSGRLKVAPDLSEAETLVSELSNFRVKISSSGHDSYDSWRDSIHDDLCLAACLAVWWAERPVLPRNFVFTMNR
jgi:hypothetical protein